jgi:membrane protease YdiL (CAAX protease family)
MRVALAITAGICEEFTVRGYAIERLTQLTNNRFVGAAVPCVLFTLGHVRLYGFGVGLLPVLATSIALTVLYVWRRNVALNMTTHALIDLYGLLLQPLLNHP